MIKSLLWSISTHVLQSSSTSGEEQYFPEYGSLGMREISILPDLWVVVNVSKHELSPAPHRYVKKPYTMFCQNFLTWHWFLMDYVSKKIDVSRIQTAIQGVIICWSKLGLMLMHFIIRNRLSWPPVHLVSTLSLIADNGPSAEIHKTVSIFLRGKIYRSLVYPVVSKLGLNFFFNLYRCSNASSWNKMTKKLENEYILECSTKRHTARISTQGVFVERGMCLGSRKRTTSCHLGLPPFDIHAYLP